MLIKNLFLSSLLAASFVAAQKDLCSQDNNEINAQGDADKLESCNTLEGDVTLGKDLTKVEFEKLKTIKGNFVARGPALLESIVMPSLQTVNGDFELNDLSALSKVDCPQLTKVGKIEWVALPKLITVNVKINQASDVHISNTQLNSLSGLDIGSVTKFDVNNNKYLKEVKMNLKTVSDALVVTFNSKQIAVSFPELIWAKNMTFADINSISLPKLQHVNGSANFVNSSITSVECKNLTEVEQTLAFIGNPLLTELDFPELTTIGGALKIHNNTGLKNIDGFPKLETVRGAVDFVGNFNNATLPSLEDVQGGFNLQTTEEFDCSEFDNSESVIKGDDYECKGLQEDPKTKDGQSGAGEGSGKGDDGSAAGRLTISALLGLSVAAIGFSL